MEVDNNYLTDKEKAQKFYGDPVKIESDIHSAKAEEQTASSAPVKKTRKSADFSLKDLVLKMQGSGNTNVKVIDNSFIADKRKLKAPCFIMNMIMGGGYPEGKFIEIFGKKSTAKSTLAQLLANEVVHNDGYVLVMDKDAESWDYPIRNIQLGLNPKKIDRIMITQPVTIEDVFGAVETFIYQLVEVNKVRTKPILIIWDSIAGTTSNAENKAKMGEKTYGDHAKLITMGHRRLEALMTDLNLKNVTFLWLNQARTNIAPAYGYQEPVTFGGDAPSFFSAVRLELTRLKQLAGKKGETTYPVGVIIKVKTIKNKVFSPYQSCNVRLFFTKGIDDAGTTFDWMDANGLIKKSTANEVKAGNAPLKCLLDGEYIYFDKGKAFKALYESETGAKLRAFIEKEYLATLQNFTDLMSGESDIMETDIKDDDAPKEIEPVKLPDEVSLD